MTTSATAIDVGKVEHDWYTEHPEGQVLRRGDEWLELWNFPIGRAVVGPVHGQAVAAFVARSLTAPAVSPLHFEVRGHASVTGAESANRTLAEARARAVATLLTRAGFTSVDVSSAGSHEPSSEGASGYALARNRRVTVTSVGSAPSTGPEAEEAIRTTAPPIAPPLVATPTGVVPPIGFEVEDEVLSIGPATWTMGPYVVAQMTGKGTFKFSEVPVAARAKLKVDIKENSVKKIAFERAVAEGIQEAFSLERPSKSGESWTPKFDAKFSKYIFQPKVSISASKFPVAVEFTLKEFPIGPLVLNAISFGITLKCAVKVEAGPTPKAIADFGKASSRIATSAVEAVGVEATIVVGEIAAGALLLAAVVSGISKAVVSSQEDANELVRVAAMRDGFASAAAILIVGHAEDEAYYGRVTQWGRIETSVREAFAEGVHRVDQRYVRSQTPEDIAALTRYRDHYIAAAGSAQFDPIREAIYTNLGGHQDGPEPSWKILDDAIK